MRKCLPGEARQQIRRINTASRDVGGGQGKEEEKADVGLEQEEEKEAEEGKGRGGQQRGGKERGEEETNPGLFSSTCSDHFSPSVSDLGHSIPTRVL